MHLYRHFFVAASVCLSSGLGIAQTIVGWDTSALTGGTGNYGPSPFAATTVASGLTVGGLTRGSAISTSGSAASGAWGGAGWSTSSTPGSVASNLFVTFSITPTSGNSVSLSGLTLSYRRSVAGAQNGLLQYSLDNLTFSDITTFNYTSSSSAGATLPTTSLSGISNLQNLTTGSVFFRLINYGASGAGTWYVNDTIGSTASDLTITGTVSPVPEPTTIFVFSGFAFFALTIIGRRFK